MTKQSTLKDGQEQEEIDPKVLEQEALEKIIRGFKNQHSGYSPLSREQCTSYEFLLKDESYKHLETVKSDIKPYVKQFFEDKDAIKLILIDEPDAWEYFMKGVNVVYPDLYDDFSKKVEQNALESGKGKSKEKEADKLKSQKAEAKSILSAIFHESGNHDIELSSKEFKHWENLLNKTSDIVTVRSFVESLVKSKVGHLSDEQLRKTPLKALLHKNYSNIIH